MNYKQLDDRLRACSANELRYRREKAQNPFAKNALSIVDGTAAYSVTERQSNCPDSKLGGIRIEKQPRFCLYPFHIHDFIEVAYLYSGTCSFTIGDMPLRLTQGQAILIDSEMPHAIEPLGESDVLINIGIDKSMLTNSFFSRFSLGSPIIDLFASSLSSRSYKGNYIVFHSQDNERLERYVKDLCCEAFEPSARAEDIETNLLCLIICELANMHEAEQGEERLALGIRSLGPVLRYISDNFQNATLAETAATFNMSPSSLGISIKKSTGMSFTQFVQSKRLNTACTLLKDSDLSVDDIARHIGYENLSFFYRIFRRAYGCTPAEYRKRLEGKAHLQRTP